MLCSAFYNPPTECHSLSEVLSPVRQNLLTNPPKPAESSFYFLILIFTVVALAILLGYCFKCSKESIKAFIYGKKYQTVIGKVIRDGHVEMQKAKLGSGNDL